MREYSINNKNNNILYKIQLNSESIIKKLIGSLFFGSILGNIYNGENILWSLCAFALFIYAIMSVYYYLKILTNKQVISTILAILSIFVLMEISIVTLLFPITDIILLIVVPFIKMRPDNKRKAWGKQGYYKQRRERSKKQDFHKQTKEKSNKQSYNKQTEDTRNHYEENTKMYYFFKNCNTSEEVKKRYHELIKEYHPDSNKGNKEVFIKIQEEYNSIKNDLS